MIKIKSINLICFCFFFSACTTPTTWQNAFLPKYQNGQISSAICELEKIKKEEITSNNFLTSKDSVWFYLNLATMQFAKGDIKKAQINYKLALDALQYYGQPSSLDDAKEFLISDNQSAYSGPIWEQTLSRLYFALTLIKMNDFGNARAILRNAEEFSKENQDANALCKYLFALFLEKEGDDSNAKILYDQASLLVGKNIERGKKDLASVVIICHNGNAPFKFSKHVPASTTSLLLLEQFLANYRRPVAVSCLPGINVPALAKNIHSFALKTEVSIDGTSKALTPFFSIDKALSKTLHEELPILEARSLARYLTRRSVVFAAQERNSQLGALVDLGCLVANAMTEADTRSWCTLPSQIELACFHVEEGQHHFDLKVGMKQFKTQQIDVKKGQLYVINIFNIHPFVTQVIL
jgi:hypothetical protein